MAGSPLTLYRLCLLRLAALLDRLAARNKGPLDDLAGSVVEDLLLLLVLRDGACCTWRDRWRDCLTPRLQCSPAAWDADLLRHMAVRCPSLRRLWVLGCDHFKVDVLSALPASLLTVDFDGQLYFRGRAGPALGALAGHAAGQQQQREPWLVQAETLLRALSVAHQKVPDVRVQPSAQQQLQLVELHLGEAQASAADIKEALRQLPHLRLLRHYQLVTALYQLHAAAWRAGQPLPAYKLRNLDVDFSHVVRCRMSPEPVLAADALQLAVQLCPSASQLRLRFDPQTPHDVLGPALRLSSLRLLSVVCVSSGQRAHLDFSDVAALLERHGRHLRSLELKVLEEVDVHQVVALCPRLEELLLSGCGNVVPPCCASWGCCASARRPAQKAQMAQMAPLRRLRLLFYADGDDFSWDHDVPQCFWRWTLLPAPGRTSHLEGIFLESPRFDADTVEALCARAAAHKGLMYPDLEVLSICRAPEFSAGLVAALCVGPSTSAAPGTLRLVHLSQCEQFGALVEQRALRESLGQHVKLVVD